MRDVDRADVREIARAIDADEQWDGIRLQWVRCNEDDPPNGGVLFVRNADKGLLVYVNGARYEPSGAEGRALSVEAAVREMLDDVFRGDIPTHTEDGILHRLKAIARKHGLEMK